MRAGVEEDMEEDLNAEEENKLINEVRPASSRARRVG
jgi:hypothetical protein